MDSKTGKKLSDATKSWAIEHQGITYFNLKYASDLKKSGIFLPFDVEGENYCMSFIDKSTVDTIQNSKKISLAPGEAIADALSSALADLDNTWLDKYGEEMKILFVDLNKSESRANERSVENYLTRKKLKRIFNLDMTMDEIRTLKFEEALTIIKAENK